MVSRAEFKRRLEALAADYAPPVEPFHIQLSVMDFVLPDDPRSGTWTVEQPEGHSMQTVHFYCRDLEHFNQLRSDYAAQNKNTLTLQVRDARAEIQTTNVKEIL